MKTASQLAAEYLARQAKANPDQAQRKRFEDLAKQQRDTDATPTTDLKG